ncbi:MAG: hypothetical protein AB7L91_00385 [Dehalococcoidia bacterium]
MQARSRHGRLVWAPSALATVGVALIIYAGAGRGPIILGIPLLAISVAASLIGGSADSGATKRTFAAPAACGAFFSSGIAGIVSFGALLLPAAVAWAVGLARVEHPADTTQVSLAGVTVGVAFGTLALLAASAV